MNNELVEKFVSNTAKFCSRQGWKIVYSGTSTWDFIQVVALDKDNEFHVVWVCGSDDDDWYNCHPHSLTRCRVENEFISWLRQHQHNFDFDNAIKIHFDKSDITVIGSDKAFFKYVHDYMEYGEL